MAIQEINVSTGPNTGNGDPIRAAFVKINQNFTTLANAASRMVGTQAGNVMEVGAFGLGGATAAPNRGDLRSTDLSSADKIFNYGIRFGLVNASQVGLDGPFASCLIFGGVEASFAQPTLLLFQNKEIYLRAVNAHVDREWVSPIRFRTSANTAVDANGFLKNASPIVKLFSDKIELNDEAKQQNIEFEKLGVGDYLIKGSTGFSQDGWYIETPKDANGNVLFSVIYETLENGDISVKTYKKKFDFETVSIVADLDNPVDITENRWIDLRLQELPQPEIEMPESIAPPDFQPTGLAEAVATVMESYHGAEQ